MIYFVLMSIILYTIMIINKNQINLKSLKGSEIEMTGVFTGFEKLLLLKTQTFNSDQFIMGDS